MTASAHPAGHPYPAGTGAAHGGPAAVLRCFLLLLRELCSGAEPDDGRGPSRGEGIRVISLRCLVRCRALSGDAGGDHRVEGAEHIGVTETLGWRQGWAA